MAQDDQTVLVLAGDIAPFTRRSVLRPFLERCSSQFRAVIYVPGNHEYYGGIWPRSIGKPRSWGLAPNVHILDRSTVQIDGVTFLGATLWTDLDNADPLTMYDAQRGMADYSAILLGGRESPLSEAPRLTPEQTVQDHLRSRAWIEKQLAQLLAKRRRSVLVTHHGVTPQSIHRQYEGNALNSAFVCDISDILLAYPPVLAIHGHTHSSFDYRVGGKGSTRVIVNPRGYTRDAYSQENWDFDPRLQVEI